MSLIDLEELKKTTGSLIGVDPGTKTLGIASSDITRLIATPFTTIKRTKFYLDAEKLFSIYEQIENNGTKTGSGLGLAICDKLTKLLLGNIYSKRDW